jgi:hypothetical protein
MAIFSPYFEGMRPTLSLPTSPDYALAPGRTSRAARAAPGTAAQHGWTEKAATAYGRYRIRQRLATGARRGFHENKIAHLSFVSQPVRRVRAGAHYATALRGPSPSAAQPCASPVLRCRGGGRRAHTKHTRGGFGPPSGGGGPRPQVVAARPGARRARWVPGHMGAALPGPTRPAPTPPPTKKRNCPPGRFPFFFGNNGQCPMA